MENLLAFQSFLSTPKNIVLTSHRNPDGDAIGSTLGLFHYLKEQGHSISILYPSEYPYVFSWMPGIEDVLIYDIEPEACNAKIDHADLIMSLDYNSFDRIDDMGKYILTKDIPTAMIDHHLFPDNSFDYSLSDSSASSTSELVFRFIEMNQDKSKVNKDISECLFTGILTDTGGFRHNVSPQLFRTVAEVMEGGLDIYKVQDRVFNSDGEKQLRLLGHCLYNRMEILPEYKTGIISLNKNDFEIFQIERGDTEGIVNQMLRIKEVKVAAFITEQPRIIKLSLRSKGDFSVQELASKHFNGGGHKNASGGYEHASLSFVLKKFKKILEEYKDKLNNS